MSAAPLLCRREWSTTSEIARASGMTVRRARKLLERLHDRGFLEKRICGDGGRLWRLSPELADRLTRERSRR